MALGFCKDCEKLVQILPKGFKVDGSKERWWHPVQHDTPEGRPCDGHKKGI